LANVVVYIELDGTLPRPTALECLGEGRRIASFLGASLVAVAPVTTPPGYGPDDLVAVLSRHGADRVILPVGPGLEGPALFVSHGQALADACLRVPPALWLCAATPAGRDIAPRLAARLGAAFVAEPSIEYGPRGDLIMARTVYGGQVRRRLSIDELERPVVATLTPGSYQHAAGMTEAELVTIEASAPPSTVEVVSQAPDPAPGLTTARVVVTAGSGVDPARWPLLCNIARALGGEPAVTRTAFERGLGAPERVICLTGRQVAPRLYIACGAAGSPAHLGAVAADSTIVAINQDPEAPIFRVANYGLVGDVAQVLPRLADLLRAGSKVA
jgi:electron transfer flavoprotein alpha subunit